MALIYVVEDDKNIQEIETFALANVGYEVKGFDSAMDFYEALNDTTPDLILLDIMLPDEDGLSIVKKLRTRQDTVLVPVQCEYYALEGLSDLLSTVRVVKRRLNPGIELEGLLLTMYDGRTNLSMQVAEEVKRHFPGKVFATVIPRNVRLSEAPSHGKPVNYYDGSSRGSVAYKQLTEEILERNPLPRKEG